MISNREFIRCMSVLNCDSVMLIWLHKCG